MKKVPVWLIILWIVFAVLGLLMTTLGLLVFHWHPALCWITASLLWAADLVWLALKLLANNLRTKRKGTVSYAGNQAIYQRISREVKEAVSRYLKTATAKGFLKKDVMYERPWFLLCGTKKSGKSSLLKGSGLHFPVTYPSEADGLMVSGSEQTAFYFANEAVWIDTPGVFMEEVAKDEWRALAASLGTERAVRPIDGLAMVVNAHEVMNTDERGIREIARQLRNRIDEVIALWGIEFPVYLIFNHADEIPGFREYFGDLTEKGQNQILGATIKMGKQEKLPRMIFAEEFGLLSRSLTDMRLDRLGQERNDASKRMVCRFVIHFEGMQEKLGALVTELFKPSNYVGRPIFRGFYFTSCREIRGDAPSVPSAAEPNVSMTIVNHPLNPKRMAAPVARPAGAERKTVVSSAFVLPLFRKIMVRDKALVTTTRHRSRQELLVHYGIVAATIIVTAVLGLWIGSAYRSSTDMLTTTGRDMASVTGEKTSLLQHYAALDVLRKNITDLQDYDRKFFRFSWGFYRGKPVLAGLISSYVSRCRPLLIDPLVRYLEYSISGSAQSFGELSGDQYSALYGSLKAYLSLSEAVAARPQDIDTAFLRTAFTDALTRALVSSMGQSRLPQSLETQLSDNIGLVLYLLKTRQFPLLQENQRLVADSRQRLQRLPNAQTIYETVINRLAAEAPQRTLDEILGRQGEGIIKSDKSISMLFTQQGWDQFVADAINDASKNPFSIDWVLGITKDQVPESMLDTKKFKDDMTAAYVTDCTKEWLAFLQSLTIDPFGDLDRSSRLLQKLTAARSELEVVLQTVADATVIKVTGAAEEAAGKALGAASQFKATKKMASDFEKKADKAADAASSMGFGLQSPLDALNAAFDPLRAFVRSTGGALSGYQGYCDKLRTLSTKCAAIQEQGEQSSISIFTGKDDDPLLGAWRFTQNELTGMPAELSTALQGILLAPVKLTGDAAAQVLTRTLNARWQEEIVKPFTNRFSGRYPFSSKGEDASFTDVMDFFRPSTGTFWGFYERVLAPYVVKTPTGWMVRSLGSVSLNFNPKLADALIQAERIRDIFFKPDGTLRAMVITISPSTGDKNAAKLEVNGQSMDLSGGKSGQLSWPIESPTSGASLKVYASKDFTQDLSYRGSWGFMKLLAAARVNAMNSSTFMAKWQINVQNMYTIQQNYRIQVSSTDHPFADPIFEQFNCPTELVGTKETGVKSEGGKQ
jgi:type VI secretion system protein ImpL